MIQDKIILLLLTKPAHARRKPFVVPSGAGAALITDTIPPANVIGIIQIDKINIEYPILSKTNDELLKISPCKFFGPDPNKVGNLCIAGHNFDDDRFFSKLSLLDVGDIIKIYAPANVCVYYKVYEMYEIEKNDMSCTSQETNGNKEITLITCNNINKKRLILKAKEMELNAQ